MMMQTTTIIVLAIICFVFVVFVVRAPTKLTRFLGSSAVRITIGVLFLFFFNVFGGNYGLHIPINLFTVAITSILGVFGVATLAVVHIVFFL